MHQRCDSLPLAALDLLPPAGLTPPLHCRAPAWNWCGTRRRGHTCVAGSATTCREAVQQHVPLAGSMRALLLGATVFAPLQLSQPLSNPARCRPRSALTEWSGPTDARLASGWQLVRNVLPQLLMCIHTVPLPDLGHATEPKRYTPACGVC